jgi:hypothetical protein
MKNAVLIQLGASDWWLSLQPPAHAASSHTNFSTLKIEAIRSSETSVHTRFTRRYIPEDGMLLKCYQIFKFILGNM